ncbi:DUF2062 domain-containing protein [Vulgatibacter sp.]|uniref:DUF2062 domain-containing protein n=1 Tax=Vulgatibacter sp. TaxID=1971226 RepID=UPI0035666B46
MSMMGRTFARLRKKARQGYVRLLKSPGAPREIAGGVALGLFVAMLPVMGVQMPLAILLAELLRRVFRIRLSRLAAAAGVWLTNPVTAAPIYGLCWLAGRPVARLLLPSHQIASEGVTLSVSDLAAAGPFALELLCGLTIGGILFGIPVAVAGYKLTLQAVHRYQARKGERRMRLAAARGQGSDLRAA